MSPSSDTTVHIGHSVRNAVQHHRRLFLAQGVITIILGMLAVIWPQISTVVVDAYIGVLFLFAGATGLAVMFFAPTVSTFLWSLLTAALSLLVGILLVWHPVEGAASLTLVLIAFFTVEGVFRIVTSIGYRHTFPDAWGWMLLSGIVDLALAALIIAGWPGIAIWALGLIVGVNLITSGMATTMVAIRARHIVRIAEKVFA